jgi:hypothetical protein
MWWNVVARTPEEIAEARDDGSRAAASAGVRAYAGARIPAPPLAARLQRSG